MRCPAYPMCNAVYALEPTTGGPIIGIYPPHDIVGSSIGRCPGSGARVLGDNRIHEADRMHIRRAGAAWLRKVVQRSADSGRIHGDAEQLLTQLADQLAAEGPVSGAHLGRPANGPREIYFPGRPADAPEPGVGERPAGRPAMDLGGGFLGRAAVDNARDQLQTLMGLAIEQIAQGQDTLAKMTGLVDSLKALDTVVGDNLRTAQGLLTAAVGSGHNVPEPAHRLRALLAAAGAMNASASEITATRVRVEKTYSQLVAAIEAAREYRALP
jgi:hypothetical protein